MTVTSPNTQLKQSYKT